MKTILRLLFTALCISAAPMVSYAQQGYIERDSAYVEGKISFDPKKPYEVSFREGKTGVVDVYRAEELTGFGDFKGKAEYVSFEVEYNGDVRPVFLRLESKSSIPVYSIRHQKRVFIFRDELIELQESSYRYQLEDVIDVCSREALEYLPFNMNAIITFLRYYEKTGKCEVQKNIEWGLLAGYTRSTLSVEANSEYDFGAGGYESTYSGVPIGLYTRIPYYPIRGLHWLIQVQYQQHLYQAQSFSNNRELDVSLKASSVQLSGNVYYEYGSGAIRPYVYGGPALFNYFGAESEMLLVVYNLENATYDLQENWLATSASRVGANWGIGFRLAKLGKTSISAEYNGTLITFADDYSFMMNNIQIKIGI